MARKKKHEEHENHERWLVSYADFITLLFAFFVVMYSVSSVNEGKYRVLSDALLAAFRSPQKTLTPIQIGSPAKAPQTDSLGFRQTPNVIAAPDLPLPDIARKKQSQGGAPAPLSEIADRVEEALSRLVDEDLIAVRHEDDYVEIEIKSEILFASGSQVLTPRAQEIVETLAKILRNFSNMLRVEGFTDDTPIKNGGLGSNWVLSAARAASVVHVFDEQGVHPARMAAVGYAQYRPVADNSTSDGRNKNRRVSIVVLNQTDPAELREDLYLASSSEDGRPRPAGVYDDAFEGAWRPPEDVTGQAVTQSGDFSVVQTPIDLQAPVAIDVSPSINRVDRVPYSVYQQQQGGGQ